MADVVIQPAAIPPVPVVPKFPPAFDMTAYTAVPQSDGTTLYTSAADQSKTWKASADKKTWTLTTTSPTAVSTSTVYKLVESNHDYTGAPVDFDKSKVQSVWLSYHQDHLNDPNPPLVFV